MSSIINTKIKPFKATAFHQGKFVPVSDQDLAGKWSVVVFYPADFTFVCQLSWATWLISMLSSRKSV